MWHYLLKNYRFTYVIIIATIFLGLVSAFKIPKESTPEIKVPVGTVMTFLNGANAEDIEKLITNEIEDKIGSLDEIDTYSSVSAEGISLVTVTFDAKSNIVERIQALKDAVDEARPKLPSEAEAPNVKQIRFDDQPIIVISLSADIHPRALKEIAEDVQQKIERMSGISEVTISGAYDRETQVILDESKLTLYGLSANQVIQTLRAQNSTLPGGTLEYNGVRYPVRFNGDIESPDQVEWIPISSYDGSTVYIKDVATVIDTTKKQSTKSRVSIDSSEPESAITLNVKKRVGGDVIRITDQVKSEINNMKDEELKGVTVFYSLETAARINEDLQRLSISGLETVIVVTLILIFILGFKPAVLTGLSIPLSFLITIGALSYMGLTINFLSLFSLILALGILVDSAIVLVEGIHSRIEDGEVPYDAAEKTITQFTAPITSGVLTTIAAMVPMLFASGMIGEFIKHIPITVSLVLISSLFVSLGFLPTIASHVFHKRTVVTKHKKDYFQKLSEKYSHTIEDFLNNRRKKIMMSVVLVLAFCFSLSLPAFGVLKVAMFPQADSEFLFFDIETPVGTTLEYTDDFLIQVENILLKDDRIESFASNTGMGFSMDVTSVKAGETPNLGYIIVALKDDRNESSLEISDELKKELDNLKGGTVMITQEDNGPPAGAPVALKFKGDDMKELERLVAGAEKILKSIPGTTSIRSSIQDTELNFVVRFRSEIAAEFGLTASDIASFLRTALHGVEATTIKTPKEDIGILVKMNLNTDREFVDPNLTHTVTIDALKSLQIFTHKGMVPLQSLVDFEVQGGQGSIIHEDGKRTVQATAYTQKGIVAQTIIDELESRLEELDMKEGYAMTYGGETEDIQESFADMFRALFIGIFLIAAILVLQFNSFKQPIFVLMTVPLAITGILPGLAIMRLPLSFTAFVGIVALSGIVVNNAILLIDRINENRLNGTEKTQAIIEATSARFRPIILTTVTTVSGILPLALSDATWGPLGFSIVFGLTFSTVLTLFVIPMLYNRFAEEEL